MGDLSKNISRSECACKCGCGFDTADIETVQVVQDACDYFAAIKGVDKVVAHFNSWCRCAKHNKEEGGTPKSKHLEGRACDWWIEGVTPQALYQYLVHKYPTKYGIGLYPGRIHSDTRTGLAYHY